jgi:hypothetical protein
MATSLLVGLLWGVNHLVMEYPAFVLGPLRWLPCLPLLALYGLFNLKQLRSPISANDVVPAMPQSPSSEREAAR